jgi:FkbM family methyltransferase
MPIGKWWLSEDSRSALRIKRIIKRSVPLSVQLAFKKYYYRRLMRSGLLQPDDDAAGVAKFVKRGDVVVDIGANVGFYSHFLSGLVGPEGRVCSFEPIPATYKILDWIMKRECPNVVTFPFALSDRVGSATMEIPSLTLLGESFYGSRIVSNPASSRRTFTVNSKTLDSMDLGGVPTFIKIDVEGHEEECLKGALETIRSHRPILLVECVVTPPDVLANLIEPLGYRVVVFEGNQFVDFRKATRPPQNVFFLPA